MVFHLCSATVGQHGQEQKVAARGHGSGRRRRREQMTLFDQDFRGLPDTSMAAFESSAVEGSPTGAQHPASGWARPGHVM